MAAITDLAAASSVAAADNLVINQSGTDKKVTADKFAVLATANAFTAAQTVVAAGVGSRQAASGNGAAVMSVGLARSTSLSVAAGQAFSFTFDGDGCLFMLWFGFAALLWAPYNNTTIVEVADTGNAVPAVLNVTKASNSRVISVANASGSTQSVSVVSIGSVITAFTNPA